MVLAGAVRADFIIGTFHTNMSVFLTFVTSGRFAEVFADRYDMASYENLFAKEVVSAFGRRAGNFQRR